jgi:hypothetical protein
MAVVFDEAFNRGVAIEVIETVRIAHAGKLPCPRRPLVGRLEPAEPS